jgi:PRTRC genetic system protein A
MMRFADLMQYQVYQGELPPANPPGYQYFMAGNGLMLRAANRYMDVAQRIGLAEVRGLPNLYPFVHLRGKLPGRFLTRILLHAQQHLEREVVYQVVEVDDRFRLRVVAYGDRTSAVFEDSAPPDRILFEAHSHNTMEAFFSATDNAYEQHFRFYAVVGRLDQARPSVIFRLGVYGYHFPLPLSTLFQFEQGEELLFEEVFHANQHRTALPRRA